MSVPKLQWRIYEAGFCRHPERATRAGAPLAACEFPALVFRLTHPQHGHLLFDTGYSRHFFRATDAFPERLYRWVTPVHLHEGMSFAEQLEREGIAADDIAWVLLSHLHGDHVGGVGDFARARIGLARAAWDELRTLGRVAALRRGLLPALLDEAAQRRLHFFEDGAETPLPPAFAAFGSGHDLFGDGSVRIVPLPGHASGHVGLLFADVEGLVLLVADAAWSSAAIRDGAPPPALVTGWLGDTAAYRATLAKLQALQHAEPGLRIVPSHCRDWRPAKAAAPR